MAAYLRDWNTATDGPTPVRTHRGGKAVVLTDADGEYLGFEVAPGKYRKATRTARSAAYQATIDAAIAAKAARVPLRIGAFMVPPRTIYDPPIDLDYQSGLTQRLAHKVTIVQGEVQAIDYYADATHTDRIVGEAHTYTRSVDGFAQSRDIVIAWYRDDDTAHPTTKTLHKVYDARESIREGKTRRGNIIDRIEMVVAGLLLATEVTVSDTDPGYPAQSAAALNLGRAFLKAARDEIGDFVDGAIPDILTAITNYSAPSIVNAPAPWFDNQIGGGATIRSVSLAEVDIWS